MKKEGFWGFLKTKGRLAALIAFGTLGLLFLLVSGLGFGNKENENETQTEDPVFDAESLTAYETHLEEELERFCEAAAGVSDVHVMVTFSDGYRREYLTDKDGNPVTVGSGTGEHSLAETLTPPAVSGVGIICRRGNDPAVQKTLVELVSTALGIPSNRVYVTGT